MQGRISLSIVALSAGILALTGCGSDDSAADSVEQAHIEQLQEIDAVSQMRAEGEKFDDAGIRIEPEEPPTATDPAAPKMPDSHDAAYDNPQDWAEERVEPYRSNFATTYVDVCGEQVKTLGGCGTLDPHSSITEISAPQIGQLIVEVEDGPWQTGWASEWPAEYVAGGMMHFIAFDAIDVEQITVVLPDGTSYTEHWNPLQYEGFYGQPVIPATRN